MNCREWRHNLTITGMTISVDATWTTTDVYGISYNFSAKGTTTYRDMAKPTSKKEMICFGDNRVKNYSNPVAIRSAITGWQRFVVDARTGPSTPPKIDIKQIYDEEPTDVCMGDVVDTPYGFTSPLKGLYKPWNESDPWYTCATNIWNRFTETRGTLAVTGWVSVTPPYDAYGGYYDMPILIEDGDPYGFGPVNLKVHFLDGTFNKIGPGEPVKFYNTSVAGLTEPILVGTGTMNYQIQ